MFHVRIHGNLLSLAILNLPVRVYLCPTNEDVGRSGFDLIEESSVHVVRTLADNINIGVEQVIGVSYKNHIQHVQAPCECVDSNVYLKDNITCPPWRQSQTWPPKIYTF